MPTRKNWPALFTVFALTCAVFSNSLWNGFNLDDDALIRDNTLIRKLSNLPKIFASNYWANTPYERTVLLYRPLSMASFALDYAMWGDRPAGFHLTNILINGVNAALVLLLLFALFSDSGPAAAGPHSMTLARGSHGPRNAEGFGVRQSSAAFIQPRPPGGQVHTPGVGLLAICALLYAFHPVHTEAVNMVVGRTELLAAMFGFLTVLCHLHHRMAAAFACFLLALLSKEIAVTIPAMIFAYEWLFARPIEKRRYAGYAALLVVYLILRFVVLSGFVAVHQTGILSQQDFFHRGLTVIKVLGYYLKLLVFPFPLTPDYSDVPLPGALSEPWVLASAAAIIALLAAAWRLRAPAPAVTFAILWFFVTILPVSNVISIGAFLGERFLYLPSLSVALLAAGLFYGARLPGLRRVLLGGCALLSVAFAVASFQRNLDWRTPATLWARVQARQPENPRSNFHLGAQAEEAKQYEAALGYYAKAIQYFPSHNWNPDRQTVAFVKERMSNLWYDLALRRYHEGKFEEAAEDCRRSLEHNNKNALAHVILGNLHAQKGELKDAVECYETALKLDPDQYEAKENLRRINALPR